MPGVSALVQYEMTDTRGHYAVSLVKNDEFLKFVPRMWHVMLNLEEGDKTVLKSQQMPCEGLNVLLT